MGLLAAIKSIFRDSAYIDGAIMMSGQGVAEALAKPFVVSGKWQATVRMRDRMYLLLDPIKMQFMAEKYAALTLYGINYHSNSDEFPDCDDFARVAVSQMLLGAIKERFAYAPAIAEVSYKPVGRNNHDDVIALDKAGQVWLWDTQRDRWTTDLSSVDYVYGEVNL